VRRERVLTGRFAALMLGVVTFGLAHSAYFLLPKYLAQELGASAAEIGNVSAAPWLANVLSVPFVGVWIDRYGRRAFAYAGAALLVLSCAGFLFVDGLGPLLFLLRVAQGISFSLYFVSTSTLAADLAPPARLSQALGIYGSAFVGTNALAPAGAEWLASAAGWPAVFQATTLLALLPAPLLLIVREPAPLRLPDEPVPGLLATLARPGLAPVLVVAALAGATYAALFTFNQPFALERHIEPVSTFLVAYAVAAVLVRAGMGGLADGPNRIPVTLAALTLYGVASIAMLGLGPIPLAALGAALGLAHGFFYPALNAIAISGSSPAARGKVMAVFNGSFNVGFSLGSVGLGYLAAAAGYPPVFVVGGVCSFAALALLAWRAPRRESV
jgi:predicted MFS family arabinose efflux permease